MAERFYTSASPPLTDRVTGVDGLLTPPWFHWFGCLPWILDSISNRLNVARLSLQGASIGATDFSGSTLLPGLYRATYYARITRAGTVSSSLTVTIGWTDGGVAQSYSGAAMVGNTTATTQSGSILISCDSGQPVTYATTYASAGATSMQYSLSVMLERVKV